MAAGTAALKLVKGHDYGLQGDWTGILDDWKAHTGDPKAVGKAGRRRVFGFLPLWLVIAVVAASSLGAVVSLTGLGKRLLEAIWPSKEKPRAATEGPAGSDGSAAHPSRPPEQKVAPAASSGLPARTASGSCEDGMVAFRSVDEGHFSFCLDMHEVTVAEYRACLTAHKGCIQALDNRAFGAGGRSDWERGLLDHPMNYVTRPMADVYCTSAGKRLPEVREWLYAAKGGDRHLQWPWGNDPDPPKGVCYRRTAPCRVGELAADPSGLEDMSGNVQEWTSTPYCPSAPCPPGSPHVTIGGHYDMDVPSKAFDRNAFWDGYADVVVGFRCAQDLR